jgi:uncharacterized glyoxalase superfamily protein PhnB
MRSNRSIPSSQVIPELAYPDVSEAAEWLCKAFGFAVRLRIANHRIQLTLGSGAVILIEGSLEPSSGSSHGVLVRVEDVDEHFARAQAAGARALGEPTTYPYGERQYAAQDFAGHRWVFSQSVADADPADWGGSLENAGAARLEAVHPVLMARDVPDAVRFFESLGFTLEFQDDPGAPRYAGVARDGVVLHLQWHDAAQWAHPGDRPAYRFFVRDVDALYADLRERGVLPDQATSGSPWQKPGDTPWGTREFHVRDPGGNVLQFYGPLNSSSSQE